MISFCDSCDFSNFLLRLSRVKRQISDLMLSNFPSLCTLRYELESGGGEAERFNFGNLTHLEKNNERIA